MTSSGNLHEAAPAEDPESAIRELRIRVGLLQSELEHVRREHAALKAALAQDIAALARRYVNADVEKHVPAGMRHVDGVIFGGWDRVETHASRPGEGEPESSPGSKRA